MKREPIQMKLGDGGVKEFNVTTTYGSTKEKPKPNLD
jgi:hypothetical protein